MSRGEPVTKGGTNATEQDASPKECSGGWGGYCGTTGGIRFSEYAEVNGPSWDEVINGGQVSNGGPAAQVGRWWNPNPPHVDKSSDDSIEQEVEGYMAEKQREELEELKACPTSLNKDVTSTPHICYESRLLCNQETSLSEWCSKELPKKSLQVGCEKEFASWEKLCKEVEQ